MIMSSSALSIHQQLQPGVKSLSEDVVVTGIKLEDSLTVPAPGKVERNDGMYITETTR